MTRSRKPEKPNRRRILSGRFNLEALEPRELFSVSTLPLIHGPAFQDEAPAVPPSAVPVAGQSISSPQAVTDTWTGLGDGVNWDDANNWSASVPSSSSNVVIPSGFTVTVRTGAQAANNLQAAGNLVVSGGSLTLTTDSTINGSFTLNGTTLTTNGVLMLKGSSTIENGATLAGSGSVTNSGTLGFANNVTIQTAFTNSSEVDWTSGVVSIASGVTLSNASGATLNVSGNVSTQGTGILSNAGTLNSSSTAGNQNRFNNPFNNTGTVHVTSGSLNLVDGGSSSSIFNVDSTATLTFTNNTYTINAGAQWNGAGLYLVTGFATVNLADAAISLSIQDLEVDGFSGISGAGSFTFPSGSSFTWAGGDLSGSGTTTFASGSVVVVSVGSTLDTRSLNENTAVTIDQSAGITFDNNATMTIGASGSLALDGSASLSGAGIVANGGLVTSSDSTGNGNTITATFNNTGTLHVLSGTLIMKNSGTSSSIFNVDANAVLQFTTLFDNTYHIAPGAQWNGAGAYQLTGFIEVKLTDPSVDLSVQNLSISGFSEIDGSGSVTIPKGGVLNWTGGTIGILGTTTIDSGASLAAGPGNGSIDNGTLENFGSTVLSNFSIQLFDNAAITNEANATFSDSTTTGVTSTIYGTGSIGNFGSISATNGGNDVNFSVPFTENSGATFELISGTFGIDDGGSSNGAWQADQGSAIYLNTAFTFNAGSSLAGSGSYQINAAYNAPIIIASGASVTAKNVTINGSSNLAVNGSLEILAGGAFTVGSTAAQNRLTGSGTVTVDNGATFAIGSSVVSSFDVQGVTLNNDTSATFLGFSFTFEDGAVFNNNGSLEILTGSGSTFGSVLFGQTGVFNNAGTFTADDPNLNMSFLGQLNNTGVFNVKGYIAVADYEVVSPLPGISDGVFNVPVGATLDIQESQTLDKGVSFTGDGAFILDTNAVLDLNDPSIHLAPAQFTMNFGSLLGSGSFTVGSDATFHWNGGTIGLGGGFSIAHGGQMQLTFDGVATLQGATLTNDGVINASTGLSITGGAVLNNEADGVFDVTGFRNAISSGNVVGDGTLNNAGQLNFGQTGVASTTYIILRTSFNNTGSVSVTNSMLDLDTTVSQVSNDKTTLTGGNWSILAGGDLIFLPNFTTVNFQTNAANVNIDGAGSTFDSFDQLIANSGSLSLTGGATLAPVLDQPLDFTNTGSLTIGASSALTIGGNFTQTASGTLEVGLGTNSSSLQIGAVGTFAGKLQVQIGAGFNDTNGTVYSPITYASASGDFSAFQGLAPVLTPSEDATSYDLTVTGSGAPDLSTSQVQGPSTIVSGQSLTVTYTVQNIGALDAVGDWTDSVYLSTGTTFNPLTAILVGRVTHTGGLGAGDSYSGSITANAPGAAAGNYAILVVADSSGSTPDPNRNNNIGASAQTISVTPPVLTLGSPVQGSISTGSTAVYELNLAGNSQIEIDLTTAAAAGAELYVSYGAVPSPESFDQMAFNPIGASDQIFLTGDQPGPYYIVVRGREGSGAGANFTLEASQSNFGITSFGPTSGSGTTTITLHGAQFSPSDTVTLIPSGNGSPIAATNVYFGDNTTISATFNLAGIASGTVYSVQVGNGSLTSTASNAFTVGNPVSGAPARPVVTITAPQFVRTGRDYTIQVNYANESNQDEQAPLITLTATNALLKFADSVVFADSSVAFLGVNNGGGPAGILPAGYQGSITVEVQQSDPVNHVASNFSATVASPSVSMDYSALLPYVQSQDFGGAEWAALWADFQQRLGPTQAGYLNALTADASLLPANLGDNTSPTDVLAIELQRSDANVTTSITGKVSTKSPGLQLGGLIIDATNSDTGDSFSGYLLNDGSFVFAELTPGDYIFAIQGALAASAAPVTVASNQHVTGVSLTATTGAGLNGVVTNAENGSLLAGATVEAIDSNGDDFVATSDANGRYSFAGLPSNTYTIVANATGRGRLVLDNVAVDTNGLVQNLSLAPEGTISGSLNVGAGGGDPTSVVVFAEPEGSNDPQLVFSISPDANGNFTLNNLPTGIYDLTIGLTGYGTAQVLALSVSAGNNTTAGAINLAAVGTVTGKVTSTDPQNPAAGMNIGAFSNGVLIAVGAADANGNYSISGLGAGSYTIESLAATNFATTATVDVAAAQTVSNINLSIQPGGVISGTLLDSSTNQPMAGIPVFAVDSSGDTGLGYTDASGKYLIQNLPLGAYHVYVQLSGPNSEASATVATLDPNPVTVNLSATLTAHLTGTLFLSDGVTPVVGGTVSLWQNGKIVSTSVSDSSGDYSFVLQQTGTFDLHASASNATFVPVTNVSVSAGVTTQNLLAGSGSLSVSVTDGAEAVAGSTAALYDANTHQQVGSATVDANGKVNFANLAPGSYQVVVTGANSRGGSASAAVSGSGTTSIGVAQAAQATLGGQVTSGGAPLTQATVAFYSTTDPNAKFTVGVDANGNYSLSNVPAGTYDVIAYQNGYAASVQNNIVINNAAGTYNFPLTGSGTTHLTGTIVDNNGNPVYGAVVSVVDSQNEVLGQSTTDKNGFFDITSATGSNLTLRVAYPGTAPQDFFANTLQVNEDGQKSLNNIELNEQVAGSGNPFSGLSFNLPQLSLPGQFWQALIFKLTAFQRAPDHVYVVSPQPSPCPECAQKLQAANDTKTFQDDDFDTAQKYAELALLKLDIANNKTIATCSANVALLGSLVYLGGELAVLGGLVAETAFVGEGATAIATAFGAAGVSVLKYVQELQNSANEAEPKDTSQDLQNAKEASGIASTGLSLVGAITAFSEELKPLFGGLGAFAEVLEFALKFEDAVKQITFTDAVEAAEKAQQQVDVFKEKQKTYMTSVGRANQALKTYHQCLAASSQGCQPNAGGGGSSGAGGGGASGSSTQLTGNDPNDLFGPAGFGPQNFVSATQKLTYTIDFENEADASAPAQIVTITEQLDSNLDLSTFSLGTFGFGHILVTPAAGLTSYSALIDDTAATGLDVQVTASLNFATATVTWTFTSIDPKTGELTSDPLAGFLPPDGNPPEGLGFVTYSVAPKASLPTGTQVNAQASVVFDNNAAIDTATFTNTLDAVAPTSSVQALSSTETSHFVLHWGGSDDANGSGISSYDIYYSINGGSFQPFLIGTSLTAAAFVGTVGDTYSFYSIAVDNAGNVQAAPPAVDTTTTIAAAQTYTIDAKHPLTFTGASGDQVLVKLSGPGSAVATTGGAAGVNADLDSLALSGTTSKSALSITVKGKSGSTTVGRIFTTTSGEGIGSIMLGSNVSLGDGVVDDPALEIGGSVKSVTLGGVSENALLKIGEDLTGAAVTALDPSFTAGAIGTSVALDINGGAKALKVASWSFDGSFAAVGAVGNVTVAGAMSAVFTAASFHNFTVGSFLGASITASNGSIGNLTATLAKQTGSVAAIEGLTVSGDSIGNISATVGGLAGLIDGTGIDDSSFTATTGKIGNIAAAVVAMKSGATIAGITNSNFTSAGAIGNLSIVAEAAGTGASVDDVDDVNVNAAGAIGKISAGGTANATAVSNFDVYAGGAIGGLAISSKDKVHGSLFDSAILAGQLQTPNSNGALGKAGLGSVTISGSLTSDDTTGEFTIAAVGNLGPISVGGALTNYSIAAGFNAGADRDVYTSDDSFNDNASIASVKVGGAFSNSSIVAGVSPGTDNYWGNADDAKGTALTGVKQTSRIGAIVLGAATLPNGASTVLSTPLTPDLLSAIEARALTSLTIGKLKTLKTFTTDGGFLDVNGNGEDSADTAVRLVQ